MPVDAARADARPATRPRCARSASARCPSRESVELARAAAAGERRARRRSRSRASRAATRTCSTQLVDHVRSGRASRPSSTSGIRVSLEHALAERLAALSPDAAPVLELVAVSGRPVREQILAQLARAAIDLPAALDRAAPRQAGARRRRRRTRARSRSTTRASARRCSRACDAAGDRELAPAPGGRARAHRADRPRGADRAPARQPRLRARRHLRDLARRASASETLAFNKAAELLRDRGRQHHADDAWRQELLVQLAEALVSAGRSTRAAEVYLRRRRARARGRAPRLRLKAGTQLMLAGGAGARGWR